MLTYRTGAASAPSAAMGMAAHLLQPTLPVPQAKLAAYYQCISTSGAGELEAYGATIPEIRPDIDPRLTALLGISCDRPPSPQEIAQLLAGNRADGKSIAGKQVQAKTKSLAERLGLAENRLPSAMEAERVLSGCRADTGTPLPTREAASLRSRFLALYGMKTDGPLSANDWKNVLSGKTNKGEPIRIGRFVNALSATRARIGYVDLCWSADKSISVAWALAPTEPERALIVSAHKDAVESAMRHVEFEIGRARKGRAGRDGYDLGRLAWLAFDHYTSRPSVELARNDPTTGGAFTELINLKVPGDPQLHTHVAVPTVVLTDDGRVGSPDLKRLRGRVHELGRLYQAFLATNLRRLGVDVVLDRKTGAARISTIPDGVRRAFSKRTMNGIAAARAYARDCGLEWDSLDDERKIALAKFGVQGDPRQPKHDDNSDFQAWRRQADEMGWPLKTVLRLDAPNPVANRTVRLQYAYEVACELLDAQLQRRAVLDESDARTAAASGLVAAGIEAAGDIDAIVQQFEKSGVRQDGTATFLIPRRVVDVQGNESLRFTTKLHADREAELILLAQAAAADHSSALDTSEIDVAVAKSKFDFESTEHGRTQRAVMNKLGTGGKLSLAIGVAGAGKSSLISPLVEARPGRSIYGAALAWRQSEDLIGAGISPDRCFAFSVFLDRVKSGKLSLDRESLVIIDEVSLLGTKAFLDLLRVRARYEFSILAVGDPLQCQAIENGPTIDLLRRALGPDAVPEVLTSVRQYTERERTTTLLFRDACATEALDLKREDATARAVAGSYEEVVAAIADLWQERRSANASDPNYTLTATAPTNFDARKIAAAIRRHRRAAGEIGADQVVVSACDQAGDAFELPLAVGDRVRLFNRVNASCSDRSRGLIGNNGSVLEVLSITGSGLTLRNPRGRVGLVAWDTLRHPENKRIRLTYGDVHTIDASQGLTSIEHIEAMPAGTAAVDAYKAYTASSRHRRTTFMMFSDGAERREVANRRPLGDTRRITEADVWANIARNLSRQPRQESALAFVESACAIKREARLTLQISAQRKEERLLRSEQVYLLRHRSRRCRQAEQIAQLVTVLADWTKERHRTLMQISMATMRLVQKPQEWVRRNLGFAYRM